MVAAMPPLCFSRPIFLRSACLVVLLLGGEVNAQTLDEARSLYAAGRLTEAAEVFRRVAAASRDTDPATAGTAWNNACVIRMNTGDLHGALADCREALRVRRITGDDLQLARALNNLGLVQQYLGEYEIAAEHFEEALALNRVLGDVRGQAINLANLGVVATQAGRYSRALDFYQRVIAIAASHGDETWSREQVHLARINQAVVLEKLGAYREALDLYRLVLPEVSELGPRRQAGLSVNLGVVYRNLGDPVAARQAFEAAKETYGELGDTAALSNVLLNLGLVYHLNLERPAEAEAAYREALRLAIQSGDRSEEIRDLCYLGRFLLEMGRTDEAESTFRSSLRIARDSGSAEGRWTSLEGLARISTARGRPSEALDGLREAMREIEQTRSELERSALRGEFFGQKRPVYAAAVEVLYRLSLDEPGAGHDAEAFAVAQRAKARVLLDALGPDALRSGPLDASGIAALIREGVLLEYFVGETQVFLWEVSRDGLAMRALGPPGPLLEAVAVTHRHLSGRTEPPPAVLRELSDVLLPDTGRRLEESGPVRIAPDSRLHYLPFEILPLPGGDGRPLIEAVDVSYLPTGSALGWLNRVRPDSALTFIGLGSPLLVVDEDGAGPNAVSLWAARFGLESLPAAADELAGIQRGLRGEKTIRTGSAATEEEFRRLASLGASIVHLASHAVVDERHGRGAAILLTPGEESDGLLYPDEIAALDYPIGLTVLAACRTALGTEEDGRALSSLTGAFLAAGSSAVLATLWDVGDRTTSAFMEQFYHQLRRGLTPCAALRKTKQRFLDDPDWNDPHVWAAYVLVGEADPVASPALGRWAGVAVLAVLACGLCYLLLRRIRPA